MEPPRRCLMGCSYSHPCGHTRSLKANGCRVCGELNADMHITCHEATRRRFRRSWCMTNSKVLVQLLCDDYCYYHHNNVRTGPTDQSPTTTRSTTIKFENAPTNAVRTLQNLKSQKSALVLVRALKCIFIS